MPRVLNLAAALQHPDDGLHPGALAQQDLVLDLHHPVLHAPFNPGDQPDSLRQEPLGESPRYVPLIAGQPGEGLAGQRGSVVGVGRGEHSLDNLPRRVDNEVQLEPVHPAHSTPAVRRQAPHGAVLPRALGVAGRQRGGVHDGDAGAPAQGADAQEEQQLGEHLLLPLHESAVGEHPREVRAAVRADPPEVEGLQGPAARGVE